MSTTFGLFKMQQETDESGCITSHYTEDDYIEIAYRSNGGGVFWKYPFEIVAHHLDSSVRIYPLNNAAQGIFTIGDIRKRLSDIK